jgi:hypothetical protein
MFVRTKTMEARIADLKEANEANRRDLLKLVDMLAEQIEWLRMSQGRPNVARMVPINPTAQPVFESGQPFLSEEEEDILALHENGHISDVQLRDLQEALSLSNLSAAQ